MAQASARYRVEILVLTHLGHSEEPRELKWIPDYSESVDFLTPPPPEEEEEEEGTDEGVGEDSMAQGEEMPTLPPPEEELEEEDPNAVVHIEEMGVEMQDAWRRLRLSAPFRPEQYLAWEQGSEAPFPLLRVHDLEVVDMDDPWAELRLELAKAEESGELGSDGEAIVFADAAGLNALGADGDEAAEEDGKPALPEPTYFYRLDGTVMLRRTRFLHLDLDLQLREAVYPEQVPPGSMSLLAPTPRQSATEPLAIDTEPPEAANAEAPDPVAFRVHALTQSRQVKSGRMEYFDGPVFGVLAFITGIEPDEADTP